MPGLLATLGLNTTPFKTKLLEAQADARHVGREITDSLSERVGEVASIVGIEEAIRQSVEYGEKVYDLSRRLSISTDSIQLWDYALRQNGSSIEAAVGAFEKLAVARQKIMSGGKGADTLVDSFNKLGVSLDDLNNKGLRNEDIMLRISEAFEKGDPQKLIGAFRLIGGRGAGELVAAFRAGLGELIDPNQTKITLVTPDQVALLKEAADDVKTLWTNIKGITAELTSGLVERKNIFLEWTEQAGAAINAFGASLQNQLGSSGGILKALGPVTGVFDIINKARVDAANAMQDVLNRNEQDIFKRQEERARSRRRGPIDQEGEEALTTKQVKEREKLEDEIRRIRNEAAKVTEASALREMTAAQRVEEITRRIARVKAEMEDAYDEKDLAQSELNLAKLNEELSKAKDEEKKEDDRKQKEAARSERFRAPDVNQLQRIGAYVAGPELSAANAAIKSESHLQKLTMQLDEQNKMLRGRTKF